MYAALQSTRGHMNLYLAKISDGVKSGEIQPPVTTREFLSWFGAQRRGYAIVRQIRRELERYNLFTTPDFESNYIDAPLHVIPVVRIEELALKPNETIEVTTPEATESRADISGANSDWVQRDPTYRLSKLAPANQAIISVRPDSTLAEVVGLLLLKNFSQLPVIDE
jgi:CBS domain-containing protein